MPTQVPRALVRKLALETFPADQRGTMLADELVRGAGAHHALLGFGGRRGHDARLEMSGTVRTRQAARRMTAFATLPNSARETPVRPWVPMTIRSMP